jgi:hypothetical protein
MTPTRPGLRLSETEAAAEDVIGVIAVGSVFLTTSSHFGPLATITARFPFGSIWSRFCFGAGRRRTPFAIRLGHLGMKKRSHVVQ